MSCCILIKTLDPHVISPLYRHIMSPYNISINRLHVPWFFGWFPAGSPPVNEDVCQHATAKAAQFAPTQHAVPQPWRTTASWQLKGLSKCHHVVLGLGNGKAMFIEMYIYIYAVYIYVCVMICAYAYNYTYIYTHICTHTNVCIYTTLLYVYIYTHTTPIHI